MCILYSTTFIKRKQIYELGQSVNFNLKRSSIVHAFNVANTCSKWNGNPLNMRQYNCYSYVGRRYIIVIDRSLLSWTICVIYSHTHGLWKNAHETHKNVVFALWYYAHVPTKKPIHNACKCSVSTILVIKLRQNVRSPYFVSQSQNKCTWETDISEKYRTSLPEKRSRYFGEQPKPPIWSFSLTLLGVVKK